MPKHRVRAVALDARPLASHDSRRQWCILQEAFVDEEAFKTSMRKFLKRVGVTSQQEIEKALQAAEDSGTLNADSLSANVTLTIPELGLHHEVDGELVLKDD